MVPTRAADRAHGPGRVFAPQRTAPEDGQGQGGARGEVHGRVPEMPSPQAAGAQVFAMDAGEDVGEAPAAEPPPPLREVGPQAGLGRHGGIGYELVLSVTMPQSGDEVVDRVLAAYLKGVEERRVQEEKDKEKEKAKTRNKIIPDVRGADPSRAGGGTGPRVIPPRRIPERIKQQLVDVPVHSPPQVRTSERIQEQTPGSGLQVFLGSVFRSELRSRTSMFPSRRLSLRSEFPSTLRSRSPMSPCSWLFLRSEFPSEL